MRVPMWSILPQDEHGDISQGLKGTVSPFHPSALSHYLVQTYLPPGTKLFPLEEAGDPPGLGPSPLRITVGGAHSVDPLKHPWAVAVKAGQSGAALNPT